MLKTAGGLVVLVAALAAGEAAAIEVQRQVDITAAPAEVWARIGDFCAIADWHPVIAACVPEERAGTTYRVLQTEDGGILRERLMEKNDGAHFYTYSILESPLPVQGYVATLSVGPGASADQAVVVWQSDFTAANVADEEAAGVIAGIYDVGLQALKEQMEK